MLNYTTILLILILVSVLYYFNYTNSNNKKENFRGGGGSHGASHGASHSYGGYHGSHSHSMNNTNNRSFDNSNLASSYSSSGKDGRGGRGKDLGGRIGYRNDYGNDYGYGNGFGYDFIYPNIYNIENTNNFNNAEYTLQTTQPDLHVTNNKVDNAKDYPKIVKENMPNYNKLLGDDNKEVKYYYNDVIDQSKITENAYDLVNQKDLIDYANIKTGLQKCEEECEGVCFELGYMGTATCFPKETKTFDYGSIYKNPTFIYG